MKIVVSRDPESLGAAAAEYAARRICEAIDAKGEARIVLSTGASQFTTLAALVKKDVDWARVTMFHLDEYVAQTGGNVVSVAIIHTEPMGLYGGKQADLSALGK